MNKNIVNIKDNNLNEPLIPISEKIIVIEIDIIKEKTGILHLL